MTGAVRAERGIARAACVSGVVTLCASLVNRLVVQIDPIGIEMCIRFDPAAVDLDLGHQILRTGNNGDGMAEVAFQSDRFFFRV